MFFAYGSPLFVVIAFAVFLLVRAVQHSSAGQHARAERKAAANARQDALRRMPRTNDGARQLAELRKDRDG